VIRIINIIVNIINHDEYINHIVFMIFNIYKYVLLFISYKYVFNIYKCQHVKCQVSSVKNS
jgi:hypothetical protein